MKVSVVIPTYNRREGLLQALQSLEEQTLSDFEIIVVDNAADSLVEGIVGDFNETARIAVRYIPHDSGGISGARNRGAREASGDILVYTDDDLTFERNWLAAHREKFEQHPDMAAAGGRVRPFWEAPPPQWLIDYIGDSRIFPILALFDCGGEFTISAGNIFFGCNMAIRKDVLFEYGGFRPELFGSWTIGSGEWGVVLRLQKGDRMIGYNPEAVVHHHIPSSRMTIDYIRKWAWHGGASDMYEKWLHRRRTSYALMRETARILWNYGGTWLKAISNGVRKDRESIDTMFQSNRGLCELNYVWWMMTNAKVKAALDAGESCC